ncbi:MAG: hypothetical protein QG594_413 [Bacteroidota bacterium]|nr:hypothetical protein [Bacteroidota bacterium]
MPNTTEREPKIVDLFDPEIVRRIREEGFIYLRKIEPIVGAQQVIENQMVKTQLPDETIEAITEAESGDWVITGSKGEKFVLTNEKFEDRYDEKTKGVYIPKEQKIIALRNPFNEPIKIIAPWSTFEKQEYEYGSEKAIMVISLDEHNQYTNDRYLIGDEEMLLSNYINRDEILAKEMKIAEEIFGTENDPDQMPITNESIAKLDKLCSGWLSSELDGNNEPISWAIAMPTQKQLAEDFLNNKITERELLDLTMPADIYDAVYFVSVITVPEHRGKGLGIKVIKQALQNIPLTNDALYFVWPTTDDGKNLFKKFEKDLDREISVKD